MVEKIVDFAFQSPFNMGIILGIIGIVVFLWVKLNGKIDDFIRFIRKH